MITETVLQDKQQQQFNTYYSNFNNLYKMIPYLKNREFAMLEPKHLRHNPPRDIRYLRAHNIQALQFYIKTMLKCAERNTTYNLYYSTARYTNGVPRQTANLAVRDTTNWRQNYWKEIEHVDFFLDIDAPSHRYINQAKVDAINICEEIPFGIEYEIRFTGCGFHVVFPNQKNFLADAIHYNPNEKGNIWEQFTALAEEYENKYSELIDTSLNDSRRIIKLPYSLSFYPQGTFICSPLSLQHLKDFNLGDFVYRGD